MLFNEAKELLSKAGYKLVENTATVSLEDVVDELAQNYDLEEDSINIQGQQSAVFSGNGKPGYLKVVVGNDGQVYITFLNDAGVPAGKPAALITDIADVAEAL